MSGLAAVGLAAFDPAAAVAVDSAFEAKVAAVRSRLAEKRKIVDDHISFLTSM